MYCLGALLFRVDYADRIQTALESVDEELKYPSRVKAEAREKTIQHIKVSRKPSKAY